MSNDGQNWFEAAPPPRGLLRVDSLLVRYGSSARQDLETFLDDLIAWGAGVRDYASAAQDYLIAQSFPEAARCLEQLSSTLVDDSALSRNLTRSWSEWRAQLEASLQQAIGERGRLSAMGIGDDLMVEIDKVVASVKAILKRLPGEMERPSRVNLEALAAINPADLDALKEHGEFLALCLEESQRVLEQVERELGQRLVAVRHRSAQAIGKVLSMASLDSVLEKRALRLQSDIRTALEQTSVAQAETALTELEALADGGGMDQPSAPEAKPRRIEVVARPPLSTLASRALEPPESPPPDTFPDALYDPPGWEWNRDRLDVLDVQARAIAAAASLTEGDGAQQQQEMARSAFLAIRAKKLLMDNESHDALVLFRDAYLSALRPINKLPESARWCQDCAWGMLVATVLAFSPREDRHQVISASNLAALFQSDLGRLALDAMDDRGVFPDLAHILLSMPQQAATRFLRDHLRDFLRLHPVALQDLARGLAQDFPDQPIRVVDDIADLLEGFGEEAERQAAASLRTLDTRDAIAKGGRRQARYLCDDALRVLQRLSEESGLAEAAREGLASRITALSDSPDPRVSVVVVGRDGVSSPSRVVLLLHYIKGYEMLRRLRVVPHIERTADVGDPDQFERPTAIGRLAPEGRAEVAVRFDSVPKLNGPGTLKINLSRWDTLEGVELPVEIHGERLRFKVLSKDPSSPAPPNPYVVGKPVQDVDRILGREEQVDEIVRRLIGEQQDNVVLVLGDRRIGKTTVLNRLRKHRSIKQSYICVFSDLQSAPEFRDLATFYSAYLIDPIMRGLKEERIGEVQPPSAAALAEAPHKAFEVFMSNVDKAVERENRQLLVLLDELEKVLVAEERRRQDKPDVELSDDVIAAIRAVMNASRSVSFVLAGVTDVVRRHISGPQNRLYNLALPVELPSLSEKAAWQLITDLPKHLYQVSTLARHRIVTETACHPYLLQYVCFELFDDMARNGNPVAIESDVLHVIEHDVIPRAQPFGYVLETIRDPNDLAVLDGIAALQIGARYVCAKDIHRHLQRKDLDWPMDDVHHRLDAMCDLAPSLITRTPNRNRRYRIEIPLVARHRKLLQQRRTSLIMRVPSSS